jgi:transcriptional regulator with XRE-family HTH domain
MKEIYFGSAYKAERTRAGKTLKDTAKALGVSESLLSRIENGECAPPREEMIIRAAEFFGSPPDELIYAAVRQREGVHAVLASRSVQAYGRLLEHFHQLEPSEVEEIDAILLRHSTSFRSRRAASSVRTSSGASKRSNVSRTTARRSPPQGRSTDRENAPDGGTQRTGGKNSAIGRRAERTARIKHSPRSDLKSKEESRDQETVVH